MIIGCEVSNNFICKLTNDILTHLLFQFPCLSDGIEWLYGLENIKSDSVANFWTNRRSTSTNEMVSDRNTLQTHKCPSNILPIWVSLPVWWGWRIMWFSKSLELLPSSCLNEAIVVPFWQRAAISQATTQHPIRSRCIPFQDVSNTILWEGYERSWSLLHILLTSEPPPCKKKQNTHFSNDQFGRSRWGVKRGYMSAPQELLWPFKKR